MDLSYLLWLQDLRAALGGALDGFFLVVSELGEAVLPLLIACGIYWCLNKRAGLYLFFTCNVGDLINGVLKLSCCVYRPWIRDARITPVEGALEGATGYSFPSGHSTKAVTAYGGLAVQSRGRKGAVIGLLIGWLWERRYVRFETAGSVGTKLLRFASGVAVLVILFFGARKGLIALLGRNWGSLLGAMLPVLYAVAAHPLLFTRVENRAGRKAEREQARA